MGYEHRFGCTMRRPKDFRHDPAVTGIFIHGGSSLFPTHHRDCKGWEYVQQQRFSANRFSITIPTRNPNGKEIPSHPSPPPEPTFQRAVQRAVKFREEHPDLAGCPIYACTDVLMDKPWSGKTGVQRVA